jgi:leader peptidase (prepilin peptidase) / N-methyltransferase
MSVMELLASSPALFIGTCLVFGLIIGSFLNVVIYRLPIILDREWLSEYADADARQQTESSLPVEPFNLVVPRSACPSCKAPITALQNIPIVSYLVLKGRCARCGVPISMRYPFVEALTGILSATIAWKYGFGWPTAAAIVLTWFLVTLTFIDVDHQLLPDRLTLPLIWMGLLLSLWGPQPGGPPIPVDMRSSIIGAIGGYLSLWSVYHPYRLLTGKEGMGYGDFKLFAALGAWLGWKMLFPIIFFAAVVGSIVGIVLLRLRRQGREIPIAFGPYLAAAGWLVLMFGPDIVTPYFSKYLGWP